MSITGIQHSFLFVGGLGMFLFGIHSMSDGIQKFAGKKMQELLRNLIGSPLSAVFAGTLITALIQSSGAVTVMVLGFVNAGIISLTQSTGVIMGANIGTCLTTWIVSLGLAENNLLFFPSYLYAQLFVGIGAFFILFSKKLKKKTLGEVFIGLGLLFIGLNFMKESAMNYTGLPVFTKVITFLSGNPFPGIIIGIMITGIIQSSSASIGILQILAATTGTVSVSSAVYFSLGSNIGSCIPALHSGISAHRNAKRAAMIHLSFNVIGVILFGIFTWLFFLFRPALTNIGISSVGISIFHTAFNITCTCILFPFSNRLIQLSGKIVKERGEEGESEDGKSVEFCHLDERILETPTFAIENAIQETVYMGKIALDNMNYAYKAILNNNQEMVKKVYDTEKIINKMEKLITEYLVKISNLSLNEEQHTIINDLFYSINDIERVGDHTENIVELIDTKDGKQITFSKEAHKDMQGIMDLVIKSFDYAIQAREHMSIDAANKVAKYEDMVDTMEEELREKHIERLSGQLCKPASGVVFLDIISNLERISDHAYNLAGYVMSEY